MEMKHRIKQRMDDLGFTQDSLGEAIGMSQTGVFKLLQGGNTRKLLALAKALQCDPEWLQDGRPSGPDERLRPMSAYGDNVSPADIKGRVPVISYVQAGQWSEAIDLHEPGFADEFRDTTVPHSSSSFALRVEGASMTLPEGVQGHSFPSGMIIFVDPEQPAEPGDYVIARHNGDGRATFKRLLLDEGRPILSPLNPDRRQFPIIRDEFEIIGKVIDASWGGL